MNDLLINIFRLTLWTNAEELRARQGNVSENSSFLTITETNVSNVTEEIEEIAPFSGEWWKEPDTYTGIYVFTILIVCVFIFSMVRTIHYFLMCMISSINLHNRMFQSIIRAPLLFFDQNPVGMILISFQLNSPNISIFIVHFDYLGRVLNRFTKDIGCMDEMLPSAFFDVITVSYLFLFFSNLLHISIL
jgi:ABC-type multidrug transport system fused ATPase/permease subunit